MLVQVVSIWSPALLDLVASRVDQSSQSPAVQLVLLRQRLHAVYNSCHHNLYAICLLAACHGLFGIVRMQPSEWLSDSQHTRK